MQRMAGFGDMIAALAAAQGATEARTPKLRPPIVEVSR